MQRLLIDIAQEDLDVIEKVAEKNRRSRKAQIEWILEDYVMKELGSK